MYRFRQLFQRLRSRTYRAYFHWWCFWCFMAGVHLLITEVLLVSVPPLVLGKALIHVYLQRQTSLIDYSVMFCWAGDLLIGYFVYRFLRPKWADEFFQLHAYFHFYQRSRRLSPQQLNRCRFSQVLLLHPHLFSYAFSGPVMVVKIGREQSQPAQLLEEADDGQEAMILPAALMEPDESHRQAGVSSEKPPLAVEEPEEMHAVSTEAQEKEGEATIMNADLVETEMTSQETDTSETSTATSQKQQEPVVPSFLELHIVIGPTIALFLVEKAGSQQDEEAKERRVEVFLNNDVYLAIVAYLATREKGVLVLRDPLLKAVYGDTKEMAKRFNNDLRRIRQAISAQIKQMFPDGAPNQEKTKNSFELFYNKVRYKTESYWRLGASCRVIGIEELNRWYQEMNVAQTRPREAAYTIEHLQTISQRLIRRYSKNYLYRQSDEEAYTGGYLIGHLSEDAFKRWAPDFYKDCREKYLAILKYIASCERKLFVQTQNLAWAKSAAALYKECAYAATCERIDHVEGEDALRKCIEMYLYYDDIEAAQEVYDIYGRRVKRALSEWIPEPKTRELLERNLLVPE